MRYLESSLRISRTGARLCHDQRFPRISIESQGSFQALPRLSLIVRFELASGQKLIRDREHSATRAGSRTSHATSSSCDAREQAGFYLGFPLFYLFSCFLPASPTSTTLFHTESSPSLFLLCSCQWPTCESRQGKSPPQCDRSLALACPPTQAYPWLRFSPIAWLWPLPYSPHNESATLSAGTGLFVPMAVFAYKMTPSVVGQRRVALNRTSPHCASSLQT